MAAKKLLAVCLTSKKFCSTYRGQPVLEMFTKENCSLCDEAKDKLKPYKHLFTLEEVDITLAENKTWFDKYKYDIPVFHMEGQYLMRHKVHEGLLMKKLDEFYKIKTK